MGERRIERAKTRRNWKIQHKSKGSGKIQTETKTAEIGHLDEMMKGGTEKARMTRT